MHVWSHVAQYLAKSDRRAKFIIKMYKDLKKAQLDEIDKKLRGIINDINFFWEKNEE